METWRLTWIDGSVTTIETDDIVKILNELDLQVFIAVRVQEKVK